MLRIECSLGGRFTVEDQSTKDILKKGFFGRQEKRKLVLSKEEALYLMDLRNADCTQAGKTVSFNDSISKFWNNRKFIAKYLTYKDWRDRGLIIKEPDFKYVKRAKAKIKEYPGSKLRIRAKGINGTFFKTDLMTILEDNEKGKELYDNYWIGQYGSYKASERGKLNKIDIFEALFLTENNTIKIRNATRAKLIENGNAGRKDFLKLYSVYKDWREKGYVIKTGFKFGTHFRVYFPGAKPTNTTNGWTHSKHVIQVFPKDAKMLISEWARAIRVAHSVRKTFILAIPGSARTNNVNIDYILYHRRGGEAENPSNGAPRYAMLSLSEDEHIGGSEISGAIKSANRKGLELILAIADRETAVTYYKVRQIHLKGSKNDYYEIDWMQP
ncbi:MAG: tRNA-intron lyase [Candidatus Marsarchaeota archaeon]|nr:tRNA-intron lyase [Candidatus Marsarchaeota archaeon]